MQKQYGTQDLYEIQIQVMYTNDRVFFENTIHQYLGKGLKATF
jgi:hypothetical protein